MEKTRAYRDVVLAVVVYLLLQVVAFLQHYFMIPPSYLIWSFFINTFAVAALVVYLLIRNNNNKQYAKPIAACIALLVIGQALYILEHGFMFELHNSFVWVNGLSVTGLLLFYLLRYRAKQSKTNYDHLKLALVVAYAGNWYFFLAGALHIHLPIIWSYVNAPIVVLMLLVYLLSRVTALETTTNKGEEAR